MKLLQYILLLGISSSSFGQGVIDGFYNGSGNLTAVLGSGYENNPTYLTGKNEIELDKSFFNINMFVGFGLAKNLDLNVAAAYVESDAEKNLQDARFILKYKLHELELDRHIISIQIASGVSFPLTNYETEGLNAIGQRATSIPARLLIHAQQTNGLFFTLQGGYDYKFDPVPNATAATLKLGMARRTYYVDAFLDFQNAINGKDYRGSPAPNNFRELEVDFIRTGVTFFKPFSSTLGAYLNGTYTVDGRNVGLGPAINAGVVYRFNTYGL
ncbi:hypothetical protein [Nonlabens marinus]|uniref:Outer membrane protein beta-barrel domain-containing protein n=1 Tax=Nonlabens marinus S1-08 TaxID=1454201 RepID=W8VNR2_9FLAO|nr:hypothetical protein [Nonlabens marinus]BAO54025.1 hypothetical protein NMS_0016 [Nonlabens marinus S1-08]